MSPHTALSGVGLVTTWLAIPLYWLCPASALNANVGYVFPELVFNAAKMTREPTAWGRQYCRRRAFAGVGIGVAGESAPRILKESEDV